MSQHHAGLHQSRWALVRRAAFKRARWRCEDCHKAGALEAHHIVPLEAGGAPYDLANVRCLCRTCHIAKHLHRTVPSSPAQEAWAVLVQELQPCAS